MQLYVSPTKTYILNKGMILANMLVYLVQKGILKFCQEFGKILLVIFTEPFLNGNFAFFELLELSLS